MFQRKITGAFKMLKDKMAYHIRKSKKNTIALKKINSLISNKYKQHLLLCFHMIRIFSKKIGERKGVLINIIPILRKKISLSFNVFKSSIGKIKNSRQTIARKLIFALKMYIQKKENGFKEAAFQAILLHAEMLESKKRLMQ